MFAFALLVCPLVLAVSPLSLSVPVWGCLFMPFDFRLPAKFSLTLGTFLRPHVTRRRSSPKVCLFVINETMPGMKLKQRQQQWQRQRQRQWQRHWQREKRVGKPTNCKLTSAKVMKSQQKRRTTFLEKWKATKLQTQVKSSTSWPKERGAPERELVGSSSCQEREIDREGVWDRAGVRESLR